MRAQIALTTAVVALAACAPAAPAQEQATLVVRHTHYFVIVNDADDAPTISVQSRQYYRKPYPLELLLVDDEGQARLEMALPIGTEMSQQIPGAAAPFYLLVARPGSNGTVFDVDRPWAIACGGGNRNLGSNQQVPQMHLYVPTECESLEVFIQAYSPNEGARVTLLDPDGNEALLLDGEFDAAETRNVPVPADMRGRVWSLTWAKPQTVDANLDDVNVAINGYLAPLLWKERQWAERYGPLMWERHKPYIRAVAGP